MKDKDIICLANQSAECKITPFGATLISYRPKNDEHDIFWLGDFNKFDHIQAIRGGIPVCWPRFAAEKLNADLPRHGFARISEWRIGDVSVDATKAKAEFLLFPDEKYNVDATAKLIIEMTNKLKCSLETTNNGSETFDFSEALHCYFNVSSLNNVLIKGLKGHQYKNSLNGQLYTLDTDLSIHEEFDAIFMNQTSPVEIIDNGYKRVIRLEKSGSQTTVVWNPAKDLAEMSEGQYKKFVCVEPSNVGESFIRLHPNETHKMTLTIFSQKL